MDLAGAESTVKNDAAQCDVVLLERWVCLSANELLFWILFLAALPLLLPLVGAVLFQVLIPQLECRSWGDFFALIKARLASK